MNEVLQELPPTCLLLDEARMNCNIARLKTRLNHLGASLNPHIKTTKCIEIAHRLAESSLGPCTVSTLEEAERLAAAGFRKIIYAVGIVPSKLPRVIALQSQGIDLAMLVDSSLPRAVWRQAPRQHTGGSVFAVDSSDFNIQKLA